MPHLFTTMDLFRVRIPGGSVPLLLNTLAPVRGFESVMTWRCQTPHCPVIERDDTKSSVFCPRPTIYRVGYIILFLPP